MLCDDVCSYDVDLAEFMLLKLSYASSYVHKNHAFLSPGARARRSSSAVSVSVVVDGQRATTESAITAATHHHHPPPQPVCCLFLFSFLFF